MRLHLSLTLNPRPLSPPSLRPSNQLFLSILPCLSVWLCACGSLASCCVLFLAVSNLAFCPAVHTALWPLSVYSADDSAERCVRLVFSFSGHRRSNGIICLCPKYVSIISMWLYILYSHLNPWTYLHRSAYVGPCISEAYIYIYIYICVCMCVCRSM